MRLLLILVLIAAIFAVVQSQRHNCKWGESGWFDCVLGRSAVQVPTTTTPPPSP